MDTVVSISVENFITIALMVLVIFAVFHLVSAAFKQEAA